MQLYLSAPGKVAPKPALELRAFAKTKTLKPGESQALSFTLTARDLASFDEPSSSWLAEAGTYTVKIGASSRGHPPDGHLHQGAGRRRSPRSRPPSARAGNRIL